MSDAAKMLLVSQGTDAKRGARLLQRVLQKHVLDPIATQLLKGTLHNGDVVMVDADPAHPERLVLKRRAQQQ